MTNNRVFPLVVAGGKGEGGGERNEMEIRNEIGGESKKFLKLERRKEKKKNRGKGGNVGKFEITFGWKGDQF